MGTEVEMPQSYYALTGADLDGSVPAQVQTAWFTASREMLPTFVLWPQAERADVCVRAPQPLRSALRRCMSG